MTELSNMGSEFRYDLTVIIPAYNAENSIARAINSVRQSNYLTPIEILIVDDFSSDKTCRLIEELQHCDPDLKLIRHDKNSGAGVARNTGLALASGRYITFLDADDYYIENQLANVLTQAIELRPDVLVFKYQVVNQKNELQSSLLASDNLVWSKLASSCARTLTLAQVLPVLRLAGFPWNKMVSANYARRVGMKYSSTYVLNDIFAHFQVLLQASAIVVCDIPVVSHVFESTRAQLSNVRDHRRTAALVVLEEIDTLFTDCPALLKYKPYFNALERDLFSWMFGQATTELRPEISARFFARQENRKQQVSIINSQRQRLIIYGLGWQMWKFYDLLKTQHEVVAWMDSDIAKADTTVLGVPVLHPAQIELPPHDLIVVCSSFYEEIINTLHHAGIANVVSLEELIPDAWLL